MRDALILGAAYLLGSIPFSWLVARAAGGSDLRRVGSGNVGATNVLRTAGVARAAAALALDLGKGAAAVWLARRAALREPLVALAGLCAIVGHVLPFWLSFRGKGVATAGGVFAVLAPRAFLVAALVFGVTVASTRYVSLGALFAVLALAISALVSEPPFIAGVAVATAALIWFRHKENLQRLRAGTESRLGRREGTEVREKTVSHGGTE
jgi:glycerol-3-phosphate acyltransferase PlsY